MTKYIFCLLLMLPLMACINSQITSTTMDKDYEILWKEVEKLQSEGKPNAALQLVDRILVKSSNEKIDKQHIKAIQFKANLLQINQEDGWNASIEFLDDSRKGTRGIVQALTEYFYSAKLNEYLNANFWRLNQRDFVSGSESEKLDEWSIRRIVSEIHQAHLNVLNKSELLQKNRIEDFETIFDEGKNSLHLRPTLYDFVCHQILDYLSNGRDYLVGEIDAFTIEQEMYFAPANEFIRQPKENSDPLNREAFALSLYRDLLSFRLEDKNESALIHADLRRLEYVHARINLENKDQVYLDVLKELFAQYSGDAELSLIYHALANQYLNLAGQQKEKKEKGIYTKRAYETAREAITDYEKSYGAFLCKEIVYNLERKVLTITTEKVNLINLPILAKIDYRNLELAYATVYRTTDSRFFELTNVMYDKSKIIAGLQHMEIVESKAITLTDEKDYVQRSAEFALSARKSGVYLLILSEDGDPSASSEMLSYQFFHVSNMAYSSEQDAAGRSRITVVDRISGKALPNVQITVFEQVYNRNKRNLKELKDAGGITDSDGRFSLINNSRRSVFIRLKKGNDGLALNESIASSYNRKDNTRERKEISLFTDRAIYRPGQTIHFKGILYTRSKDRVPELMQDEQVKLRFLDVNNKEIAAMNLVSNSYGSVNGHFSAPSSGLFGVMRIVATIYSGQTTIRVEEYKRPKFKVELENPSQNLLLNEEVEVSGKAINYAGTALSDANVSYKVMRSIRYPFYWCWWLPNPGSSGSKMISKGETQTDENGGFKISFIAEPDQSADDFWKPVFQYEVMADVTDLNGETRSGKNNVQIGSKPYYVSTSIGREVMLDTFASFDINFKNAMGIEVPASIGYKLVRLKKPAQNYIRRYWQAADYNLLNESEFTNTFPHYSYGKELTYDKWAEEAVILEGQVEEKTKENINLGTYLTTGVYKLVVENTEDDVSFETYFIAWSENGNEVVTRDPIFIKTDQMSYEPGEEVKLFLASPWDQSVARVTVEKQGVQVGADRWIQLDEIQTLRFPVSEQDRGGYTLHILHVANNRETSTKINIPVPWSNKKLDISWETFRDKLMPGQEERWTLTIKGPDKEQAAAELLAGMYDASLDAFVSHKWSFNLFPTYYSSIYNRSSGFGQSSGIQRHDYKPLERGSVDRIMPYMLYQGSFYGNVRSRMSGAGIRGAANNLDEVRVTSESMEIAEAAPMSKDAGDDSYEANGGQVPPPSPEAETLSEDFDFAPRENLNETVFFFPDLRTDEDGNVVLEFKMNEALTAWKLMLLAHTKDLKSGMDSKEVVTQKDLMVFPQLPRFVREGDEVILSAKINRLSEIGFSGKAKLDLTNSITGASVNDILLVSDQVQDFDLTTKANVALDWKIKIPKGFVQPLDITIKASGNEHTDGELNTIPVLTNRILITETLPLPVRSGETKDFSFVRMGDSKTGSSTPFKLTLEFTQNPVWYAVQALPYIMEYPHECTEQILHRYYANAVASHMVDQYPAIKAVFNQWKDKDELISNLRKNQELKNVLLEETPWVMEARSEEEQMKNIALLFDYNKMRSELDGSLKKLLQRQLGDGSFNWFPGGRGNIYITQLVLETIGHLDALGIRSKELPEVKSMLARAASYVDEELDERYSRIKKKGNMNLDHLSVHYLYVRSFYSEIPIAQPAIEARNYYYEQAKAHWVKTSLHQQALLALAFERYTDRSQADKLLASFNDRAIRHEEKGMYWKQDLGYFWYQQPIETHAILMEFYALKDAETRVQDDLRIWLLKHKQTNRWKSTVATAKAIYALLINGSDWLKEDKDVQIIIGREKISDQIDKQAGSGYFKTSWSAAEISSKMDEIKIINPNDHIAWGALYYQYFEEIDKVSKSGDNPLKIKRTLFKEVIGTRGAELIEIRERVSLKVGDKFVVQLVLEVDRPMQFVHLKDLRAAGLEPLDVLSGYRWNGGLGYYMSTTDVGTHFFIDYLPQGKHVLQYKSMAFNAGDFSGGLSTLQCMYAPEFASHAAGSRLNIER